LIDAAPSPLAGPIAGPIAAQFAIDRALPDEAGDDTDAGRPPANLTQADDARLRLEEMIVTLELKPGTVWSEAELSERLNIGRTPVREALKRLEAEHLVEIVPRNGAKITEIDVMQQLLMLEMRRELERLIATSAARRATIEERTRCLEIARHLERMQNIDVMTFLRYHYGAKRFLTQCARNPFVASAIVPCHTMSRRFYYLHHRVMHDVPVAAGHHASVFEAVAIGDEKRAAAASDALMDYAEELTRRTVLTRF
jgi:DNA-binding GntR family transcriptional regulator